MSTIYGYLELVHLVRDSVQESNYVLERFLQDTRCLVKLQIRIDAAKDEEGEKA